MTQMTGIGLGAPLGGFITDYFGWRNCFYLNILPCLFILTMAYRLSNYTHIGKRQPNAIEKLKKIDFVGAILISASTASLVTAMVMCGNLRPWTDPLIIGLLSMCAATLIIFILHEWYLPEGSKCHALMPRYLISERNVFFSCLLNSFNAAEIFAYLFLFPQFYMVCKEYSSSVIKTYVFAMHIGRKECYSQFGRRFGRCPRRWYNFRRVHHWSLFDKAWLLHCHELQCYRFRSDEYCDLLHLHNVCAFSSFYASEYNRQFRREWGVISRLGDLIDFPYPWYR